MKKIILCFSFAAFLLSCNNDKDDKTATSSTDSTTMSAPMSTIDLPYTASYSSSFTTDVSDADLKMVLTTYKDWETGNLGGLPGAMADTVDLDFAGGEHFRLSNADLMKMWTSYRNDTLSAVTIDMQGWQKMYAADKKEGHIVTWYKEIDTYKNGKVDSAYYHDINRLKDGKITWYAQYKRPAK
ncbi:MAG: hypothetical protein JJE22_20505 [Bacteroidia bacterium]|nr:hypothetical protein [Bacteroidia bacterium]